MAHLKHLLSISDLSLDTIFRLLRRAFAFRDGELAAYPDLRVALLFLEPSTRTRLSFLRAALQLAGEAVTVEASRSALRKGETVLDTLYTLRDEGYRIVVLRTPYTGHPLLLAPRSPVSLINAGDGQREHPTQALGDLCALLEALERMPDNVDDLRHSLTDVRVVFWGDLRHSRVLRSVAPLFAMLGARIHWHTHPWLSMPEEILSGEPGLPEQAQVWYALRTQRERGARAPDKEEFHRYYGIRDLPPGVLLMHPGPYEPGMELRPAVAHAERSLIGRQVAWGVWMRMAILEWIHG